MASTVSNLDINVMANITLDALIPKLDEMKAFALAFDSNLSYNDLAKIVVEGVTKDAAAFNASSNHYETSNDDTSTGVDITLNQLIKKTAFIEEWDLKKVNPEIKLRGLANAVQYQLLLDSYNTLTAANYTNTEEVVGAASAFDLESVIDLEVSANTANFLTGNRYLLCKDSYLATIKKDGVLVANKNRDSEPMTVWNQFEQIANFKVAGSTVLNDISGTASSENLVGFITDGTAMGIAVGMPAIANDRDYEVANAYDPVTKVGIQLRRHVQRSTGRTFLNAIMLYGRGITRSASLTRLVSA
jgi:hypothetical protein